MEDIEIRQDPDDPDSWQVWIVGGFGELVWCVGAGKTKAEAWADAAGYFQRVYKGCRDMA